MCGNPNARLLSRVVIDFLLLLGVYGIALLLLPQVLHTYKSGFFCNNVDLDYPYRQPLLTKAQLTLVVVALPSAFLLVIEMLRAAFVLRGVDLRQRYVFVGTRIPGFISECYKIIGVYLFGLGLAVNAIQYMKSTTGRLRPFFFDVCQPTWGDMEAENCAVQPVANASTFIENYQCTEFGASVELLALVRQSFPSGFATTASYATCFLMLYSQARLVASWLRMLRATLQFGFAMLGLFIALERFSTHQNHLSDVVAGVAIGCCLATFVCVYVARLFDRLPVKRRQYVGNENIYGYSGYNNRLTYRY